MSLKSFKRSQQRQRQQRQAILHKKIDLLLADMGVNLPPAVKSVKSTQPAILGEVIKRGVK